MRSATLDRLRGTRRVSWRSGWGSRRSSGPESRRRNRGWSATAPRDGLSRPRLPPSQAVPLPRVPTDSTCSGPLLQFGSGCRCRRVFLKVTPAPPLRSRTLQRPVGARRGCVLVGIRRSTGSPTVVGDRVLVVTLSVSAVPSLPSISAFSDRRRVAVYPHTTGRSRCQCRRRRRSRCSARCRGTQSPRRAEASPGGKLGRDAADAAIATADHLIAVRLLEDHVAHQIAPA